MRGLAHAALPLALSFLWVPRSVPAQTTPTAREGYVDAGANVRLFYRVVGAGADTIVVLHGGPGFTMDYLAADLEPLAARHALLFYDQRGAGRSTLVSDSASLDAQRFAEDLEAVRKQFRIRRLTLFAHSWGAGVAALYGIRYPERVGRLIIVGGLPLRGGELTDAFARLDARRDSAAQHRVQQLRAARLARPGDAAACRSYYQVAFVASYGDTTAARRRRGDFCAGTPAALANKINNVDRFTMRSIGDWDWRQSLRVVNAPALVIHGMADFIPVASARAWATALPNARLLLLDGIGHFPYVEVPDRFFRAVEEFLRMVE